MRAHPRARPGDPLLRKLIYELRSKIKTDTGYPHVRPQLDTSYRDVCPKVVSRTTLKTTLCPFHCLFPLATQRTRKRSIIPLRFSLAVTVAYITHRGITMARKISQSRNVSRSYFKGGERARQPGVRHGRSYDECAPRSSAIGPPVGDKY